MDFQMKGDNKKFVTIRDLKPGALFLYSGYTYLRCYEKVTQRELCECTNLGSNCHNTIMMDAQVQPLKIVEVMVVDFA